MKPINEHIVSFRGGSFNLPQSLEIDHDYRLLVEGSISKTGDESNEDGTIDRTYYFKPKIGEVQDELGKTIPLKDKRRMSQKLRGAIWYFREEEPDWFDAPLEEEEFYQMAMGGLVFHLPEVMRYIREIKK